MDEISALITPSLSAPIRQLLASILEGLLGTCSVTEFCYLSSEVDIGLLQEKLGFTLRYYF